MDNNFKEMLSDRFGMFVHYGAYSTLGGRYKGEEIWGLGEWIQRRAEIPIADYEECAVKKFAPAPDFAKNLVSRAKAAGIRYIVLTSKHHDGFCLFNSKVSDYNIYKYTGRDLCRELADACREEGLGLGFYYSHTLDWHEKNGAGNYEVAHPDKNIRNRNYWDYPDDNIDFGQYFREKCLPQVRELLTNYGDLKLIWFDYPHDITYEESLELRELVKSIQPNCLINSRIGHGLQDYNSLGDNGLPSTPRGVPTECLITLNHTWGYKSDDHDWKSPEDIIGVLCRTLAADSTLLLNVGPYGNGYLTPETEEILSAVGEWTSRNREAIYGGISGNPFKSVFSWGEVARRGSDLFLYVRKPVEKLSLSGVMEAPISAELLGYGAADFTYIDETVTVNCPSTPLTVPVYKLSFSSEPKISDALLIDSTKDSLSAAFASVAEKVNIDGTAKPIHYEYNVYAPDFGKNGLTLNRIESTNFWVSSEQVLTWSVSFGEAGDYGAEIVCTMPSYETVCGDPELAGAYTLSVGDMKNPVCEGIKYTYNISSTGDFNKRFVKDAGVFKIDEPKKLRVTLSKECDELGIAVLEVRLIKL